MKLEAEYQDRENQVRIALQQQMLVIKEDEIQGQKLLNASIAGVVLVFLIIAVTLIKSSRKAQEINKILDEKIREQTSALQQSYDTLLRASKEKEILLQRTSSDISTSIATLNGLYSIGLQDITDPDAKEYLSKINFSWHSESSQKISNQLICETMRIKFYLVMLLVCISNGYSQQIQIDSLKKMIEGSSGINKYDPLIAVARIYFKADKYNEALIKVNEANQIAGDNPSLYNNGLSTGYL